MDATTIFRVGGVAGILGGVAMWFPRVIAQADPSAIPTGGVAQTGALVGASAFVMALGAFFSPWIKAWTDDRDKGRKHELDKLRLSLRSADVHRCVMELVAWTEEVHKANPQFPKPPVLPPPEVLSNG